MSRNPEILDNLTKTEVKNILSKVKGGGTMTATEKKTVGKYFGPGQRKKNKFLTSMQRKYCQERVAGVSMVQSYMNANLKEVKKTSANAFSVGSKRTPLSLLRLPG